MWEDVSVFHQWEDLLRKDTGRDILYWSYREGFSSISERDFGKLSLLEIEKKLMGAIKKIGPVILLGHSTGGLLSQLVSAKTELVKASVLVASAPPKGISALDWPTISRMWRYQLAMWKNQRVWVRREDLLATQYYCCPEMCPAKILPESGRMIQEVAWSKISTSFISSPVLVIAGEKDRIVSFSSQNKIAKKYGAKIISFPEMGHMLMIEKDSILVARTISDWINSL